MKELLLQALISLGVAVITLIGGYFIYGPKLRKQQKSEFQKEIGKKKADALIKFKEIIDICDSIELYNVENIITDSVVLKNMDVDAIVYPGFMESEESWNVFMEKISALRKLDMYLDNEAAAYLLYLYRYMYEFLNFKLVNAPNVPLNALGTLMIVDFQNWSCHADKVVVQDINAAKVEIQSHKDEQWDRVRNSIYCELYEESVLNTLQKDFDSASDKERNIINMFNDIVSDCTIKKKTRYKVFQEKE